MIKQEMPIYIEFVQSIRRGFSVLDSSIQNEITDFIISQQSKNGGFMDRSGNPDPYYSLFGHWLCLATKLNEQDLLLVNYINKLKEGVTKNIIDKLSVLLISIDLFPNNNKYSLFSILKEQYKNSQTIDPAYHFFLLTLIIDAAGKNKKLYYLIAKIWLSFYNPGNNIPCSLLAALTFAKNKVGLKYKKQQSKLLNYSNENGGFKVFKSAKNSDMLSTGVTLFVLEKIDYDLRMIKPGCLNFVEYNYLAGAFLSGDGDKTKDLEYTFYGLLALGSLVEYEKQT